MAHGNEEQKQRWLPVLASGDRRGALSLSEPDAGSDTRNISCRATRDGDEYVVNGTKAWVTNGERSSLVALAARTEEGISAFIVEKEPGPDSRASRSARTSASSATGASRRSRCPTSTTGSRPPTSSARRDGGSPRSSACSRWAASTSPPGPWGSPGPPSMPPWATPSSATPSASPSPSTRPSSSSWPTWPPAWRRPGC